MSPNVDLALLEERDAWCVEIAWWWGDACLSVEHQTLRVDSRATIELPTSVGDVVGRGGASGALIVRETRCSTPSIDSESLRRATPSAKADNSEVARQFSGRASSRDLSLARDAIGELIRGDETISLVDAIDRGIARAHGEAFSIPLDASTRCRIRVGHLDAIVSLVRRAQSASRRPRVDRSALFSLAGALAFSAGVLATALFAIDRDGLLADPDGRDSIEHMIHALSLENDFPVREVPVEDPRARDVSSRIGRAHDNSPGAMGSRHEEIRDRHYSLRHVDDDFRLPHVSPRDQIAARGIFAAIGSPARADSRDAPNSPFGGLDASGDDTLSHQGLMTAESAGNAFGYDGLGRSGIGFGGGGTGEGSIGTSPLGWGGAGRGACGCGEGMGTLGRGVLAGIGVFGAHTPPIPSTPPRATSGPHVCGNDPAEHRSCGEPSIQGLLSPDAIRRVVLRNIGQVSYCHEQGLRSEPDLHGRVAVRFVISSDGTVLGSAVTENVSVADVGDCIARAVRRWQFPAPPSGGVVTVTYPFRLERAVNGLTRSMRTAGTRS